LVLDNTCGSGSTLEAAELNGRNSIGIEKDAGYFEIARNRLEQVTKRLSNQDLPMFAEVTP
jgi:DNA modification methylase